MKKLIAILLTPAFALTLVFMLTACAHGGSADAPENTSRPETPALTIAPPPATTPIPAPTPAATADTGTATFPYQFEAVDLFGNTVTAETLGRKDAYFIHLWATWCPPCVAEMPDFPELMSIYEERVGFLALLIDYNDAKESAARMVKELGIPDTFYMVDAYEPSVSEMLGLLDSGYVPTTVLVTEDGAGSQIVGAGGLDGYSAHIDDVLD